MRRDWQHILWDWNGTLLADTTICVDVLNELMKERGLNPISHDHYRETFDFPVIEFYRSLGFPTEKTDFEATSHQFISRYNELAESCPLHPGAYDLIHDLARENQPQSVLSAAQQSALELAVKIYGFEECFDRLLGAKDIFAHGKEERGIDWINASGLDPQKVVLIGDTLHDHKVAEAMGIQCLLVAHGHHSPERLGRAGCPVVNGFAELGDWLHS
ncbi:HAD hydrolase-like protein [Puniceicoccus vermicola]|uniref:phosphoglycolate phosphatase n=1 Tax=Puniceicoccus vermicola TaxID=388746 RepID=A0A7X1E3X1_9BACT|nr:HAD family hydrolase [Puniceicoccus vermicola]